MSTEFRREDRYIVIKLTDMEKAKSDLRNSFSIQCRKLHDSMLARGAPARSFLVIESDWPEYEPVWQIIARRMTGQPAVSAAEELDAVLHWRNKHAVAIKERDALQQRLTAADEANDKHTQGTLERLKHIDTLRDRVDLLEGLLRDINDAPGGSQFKKHIDAALKPAEGGGAAHTSE